MHLRRTPVREGGGGAGVCQAKRTALRVGVFNPSGADNCNTVVQSQNAVST